MWPKFVNSSIYMREANITSILKGFNKKKIFYEGFSWFNFNNLGLELGMALKFDKSVTKELKLKLKKF